MQKIWFAVAALFLFSSTSWTGALAAETKSGAAEAPKMSAQQQRMKDCNAEAKAKSLKGDKRKAFMKSCLSGDGK